MDQIDNQMASSFSHRIWKYDVFISFRGEDTRKTFVSHLDKALFTRGVVTFKDNRKLEVGDSIPDELCGAIRTSRFAVVVISEKYATSRWCLDELQLIMEEEIEVVPIFYGVKPCDVRHQLGNFSLEKYQNSEKVPGWRKALKGIADRKGKESTQCVDDAAMIEEIVQSISSRLLSRLPIDFSDIVGMETHMKEISPLLDMDSKDDARFIGISGTGGIGKTTIAKYLYEKLKLTFSPHHYFMENVAKLSGDHGLLHLQHLLLSTIFREDNINLESVEHGRQQLQFRLRHVKVFLVLDDVDDVKQLCALANDVRWFGSGSRIILTTQDKGLLNSSWEVYDVEYLDDDKALQLFQQIAFEGRQPPSPVYTDLSRRASRLAQGLPLALKAFGFYLQRKSLPKWEDALESFEYAPSANIPRILNISYDSLDELSKSAFLHVTCLFNGDPVWRVKTLLDRGGVGIKVLAKKSLIDISADGHIAMHDLLEQKGRDTVLPASHYNPAQQQNFWRYCDIHHALADKSGTTGIEGIMLDVSELIYDVDIEWEHFKPMKNLNFLKIYDYKPYKGVDPRRNRSLKGILLPCKLRLLHWEAYPFTTLPSVVHPDCLVELNLSYSKLTTLWSGTPPRLLHLKRLILTGSKDLKELPDLQEAVYLEELMLQGCISLTRIPESVCSLPRLQKLDLSNCDGLKNLRIIIGESEATLFEGRSLHIRSVHVDFLDAEPSVTESRGISLTNLSIKGNLEIRLKPLGGYAEHLCFITELQIPHQLMMLEQQTAKLMTPPYCFKSLDIVRFNCNKESDSFKCCSFLGFPWLAELNLINLNIKEIPDDIYHMQVLEKLDLSGNDFRGLPTSMMLLSKLKHVALCNCPMLEALPELYQLETLTLSHCTSLRALVNLPQAEKDQGSYSLLELRIDNCKSVESLSDDLSHFTKLRYLDISRHDFEAVPTSIKTFPRW